MWRSLTPALALALTLLQVRGAPDDQLARGVGKAVVNSPLFKAAVAGNDPNVGRLVSAVGSYLGRAAPQLDLSACTMVMGGRTIFVRGEFSMDAPTLNTTLTRNLTLTPTQVRGEFAIDAAAEDELYGHMLAASLVDTSEGGEADSLPFPPHERCVEVAIDLGSGDGACSVHRT